MTDRYEIVLDLVEHPEKYSPAQIDEILSDPETREIYNLLCKTDSAMKSVVAAPDVEAEWERFANRSSRPHYLSWLGSRAASIAVFALTSLAAVAVGIAVTVSLTEHKTEIPVDEAVATPKNIDTSIIETSTTDSVAAIVTPILFEDEPLGEIMEAIAHHFGVTVVYNNDKAAELHLYYRLNPTLPLDEVIDQLNTFEQINIHRNGNTLTVD